MVQSIGSLRRKAEFNLLRKRGRKVYGPWFCIYYLTDYYDNYAKIAFSIPRYIGKAVERNRRRRQLRSILNTHKYDLPGGIYLISVNKGVAGVTFKDMQEDIIKAVYRMSVSR